MRTVYLAGKITGDGNYRDKFNDAAAQLEAAGFVVLNPAMLPPEGFSYDAYIRMSYAMLIECEAVCLLPDWVESRGATIEALRAMDMRKAIFQFDKWLELKERAQWRY